MDLQAIQTLIEADDFTTSFEPATPDIPLDRLFVLLNEEKQLLTELLFIPLEAEVENVHLLQFYVNVPIELGSSIPTDLQQLILNLNAKMPIGSFGINGEDNLVYFRYVLVMPQNQTPEDNNTIVQSLWLVFYLVESFLQQIQAVAA
ncbi:MAG: hypothetical protein AAF821_14440 [Cyanobacteria bacterium P01_D01_bin.156]